MYALDNTENTTMWRKAVTDLSLSICVSCHDPCRQVAVHGLCPVCLWRQMMVDMNIPGHDAIDTINGAVTEAGLARLLGTDPNEVVRMASESLCPLNAATMRGGRWWISLPRVIELTVADMSQRTGRNVPPEEAVGWLVLGGGGDIRWELDCLRRRLERCVV